jgi:restriction system protein
MTAKKDETPQLGKAWEGRLEEWLRAVLSEGSVGSLQNWSFPTDELRDEYLETIESRTDAEVRDLLRLFLFDASTFGADDRNRDWFLGPDIDPSTRGRLSQLEYYRRLPRTIFNKQPAHPGVRWILDLLPNNPRMALAAIEAYLIAHAMWLPDGRASGLHDAIDIIRARYVGRPASAEGKRQVLFELSPRDFERLVRRLYAAMGYEATLTPPGRDGGRDVIAVRAGAGQREQVHIECKLYTLPVGVHTARSLLGVVSHERANKGILVTSSHFTRGARDLADSNPRLDLITGSELVVLLNEHFGPEWPSRLETLLMDFEHQRDTDHPDA